MRSFRFPASLVVTTLVLVNSAAYAQTSTPMQAPALQTPIMKQSTPGPIDSTGNGAIPSLPLDVQVSNGISYINGGIGDEEVAEIKSKEHNFNVHVLVSAPNGEFISDVSMDVLDSKGASVLKVNDAGPYFYVQLPPGAYTLQATANGVQKKIKITAPKSGAVKKQFSFGEAGGISSPHNPTATID